jgi:hypothetical protein
MRRELVSLVVPGVCLLAACSSDPNANAAMTQSVTQLLGSVVPPVLQSFAGRSAEPRSASRERASSDAPASAQGAGSPPAPSPSQPPSPVSPPRLDFPHGPDTCEAGFVWREASPDDHVCVSPEARQQTREDNAHAAERKVRS